MDRAGRLREKRRKLQLRQSQKRVRWCAYDVPWNRASRRLSLRPVIRVLCERGAQCHFWSGSYPVSEPKLRLYIDQFSPSASFGPLRNANRAIYVCEGKIIVRCAGIAVSLAENCA